MVVGIFTEECLVLKTASQRFYAALGLFGAWVLFLSVMAFTSGEPPKPRGGVAMPAAEEASER